MRYYACEVGFVKTWQVIEALRKEKKISKSRLAELMGEEPYTITNWTTRNNPPLDAIVRLARIFDVPVEQIASAATVLGNSLIPPVRSQPDLKATPKSADIPSSKEKDGPSLVKQETWDRLRRAVEEHPDPVRAVKLAIQTIRVKSGPLKRSLGPARPR